MKAIFPILCVIMGLVIQACTGMGSVSGNSRHRAILLELSSKGREISSYAYDCTVQGMWVKRMYFQFEKSGRPFYRFREDLIRGGKRFVYIYNADGIHDYQYYPDDPKAYQCPTSGAWNETNYDKARDWHFDYQDAVIVGQDVIRGKKCRLVKLQNNVYAISDETGVRLAKMNNIDDRTPVMVYEKFEFDLKDEVFEIPAGVRVTEQKECLL
jgi:hypothetical protein